MLILVGCQTQQPGSQTHSPYLYPDSSFVEERTTTVFDDLDRTIGHPVTRKEIHDWYARAGGMTETEWQKSLNDPFHIEKHSYLVFGLIPSRITAKEIAEYYEPLLDRDGWRPFRAALPTESTMGSDWIRAYKRDHQLLEIHISGPWEESQTRRASADFRATEIRFRLLGLDPTTLFGNDYRLKGKEPYQEQYHRVTARNLKEERQ